MVRLPVKAIQGMVFLILLSLGLYYLYPTITRRRSSQATGRVSPSERNAHARSFQATGRVSPTEREPEQFSANDHADLQTLRKYGHVDRLPTREETKNMSLKHLYYIYNSFLDNIDFLCHRKLRMGKVDDGGWEVCDDYNYRPMKPCVVYSFGISNDFTFDDDIGKLYGCEVHSFDPSMKRASHRRSERVYFHDLGLGGSNGTLPPSVASHAAQQKWRVLSFSDIRKMLKHEQIPIDVVKIDIEHSEWPALENMAERGELTNIRQLVLEFHDRGQRPDARSIRTKLHVLEQLETHGYRRFFTVMNIGCGRQKSRLYPDARANCYEVYFVNTRLSR